MKVLLWFLSAFVLGTYISKSLADPDLWWHITVGNWVLSHLQVPHIDIWTVFASGQPWRAYSWSNEVIYALFHRVSGIYGIIFLQFIMGSLLALSFFYCFGRLGRDWFFGLFLGLVIGAACIEHFSLRPQTTTWLFMVWLLYSAHKISTEGLSWKRSLSLFVIMAIWANTHISTALGLVALAGWIFTGKNIKEFARAIIPALLGTLCTPYLGGEWLTFFATASHPASFNIISEFQPATILHYSTGILIISIAVLLSFIFLRPRAFAWPKLIVTVLFVLAGLAVVKFIPMALVLVGTLIAEAWASTLQEGEALGNFGEAFEKLRMFCQRISGAGMAFLLLCLVFLNIYKVAQNPINESRVPVKEVEFIKTHALPHPLLNAFSEGGYLMYAFSKADGTPEHKVFIDGRTNLISKDLWKKYFDAFLGQNAWKDYLNSSPVQTILWRTESPFTSLLIADGNWCRVFKSGTPSSGFSVFVAKSYWEESRETLKAENCG